MKNKIFYSSVLFVILSAMMVSSCNDCIEGNGKMATRTAKFTEITAVNLSLSADVKLVADSSGMVKIEGESNIIEAIILEQSGTKLRITSDPCFSSNNIAFTFNFNHAR